MSYLKPNFVQVKYDDTLPNCEFKVNMGENVESLHKVAENFDSTTNAKLVVDFASNKVGVHCLQDFI